MSHFTEGDSAVNRLNAAVSAFEKVLTEPEGTVVEMPVGAAQPSLAERLKRAIDAVTIKPAQAATQATTAAQQALASQQAAAQSAADAANSAAATGYVDAPFPDVWAPLNDDLRLLAGLAPADTITVGGTSYPLPTKSMTFTRSTTATYIDKSGVLKTAAVNEPRFEREGLLMEGQSTNYILNSDDPTKWASKASSLATAVVNDGATQAVTLKGTSSSLVNNLLIVQSNAISLVAGDSFTLSARFKGAYGNFKFRIVKDSSFFGDVSFSFATGAVTAAATGGMTITTITGSDGYTYATATLTGATAGSYIGQIWAMPAGGDTNIPIGAEFYIQTIQLENNPVATSYIPTGSAAVTRASDSLEISPLGNIGYRLVGDSFTRTIAFEISVNRFFNPAVGYVDVLANWGARNDIILRCASNTFRSHRSSSAPVISNVTFPFSSKVYAQTIDTYNSNELTIYFDGKSSTTTSAGPTDASTAGKAIRFQGNANIVYHIRNFRIWHRLLTQIQIKGLR